MRLIRFVFAAVLLFVSASIASATTLFVPTDRELAGRADAIVTGTITGATARQHADGYVFTDYQLDVDGVVKGGVAAGQTVVISELGGEVAGRMTIVEGSARYDAGERVLVFLRARGDGTWYTAAMTMGRFRFTRASRGEAVLVRDDVANERPRLAQPFLDFLRDGARGTNVPVASGYGITTNSVSALATNPGAYCITVGPPTQPVRWQGCDTGCNKAFRFNGTIAGLDITGGLSRAAAAWTNDPISPLTLSIAGTSNATSPSGGDGENSIIFNFSGALSTGVCDSNQACTIGTAVTPSHTFGGDTFYTLVDADIVFRPVGFTQGQFETLMCHEFGHAIGFRHSDQGVPSATTAIMASTVNASLGTTLRTWDKEAIETVYGSGPPCEAPAVISTSGGGTVASGSSVTLSVTATGSSTLNYQWYDGASGNTTTPVGTNSATFSTGPITTAKSYWVKVTNACGNASSSTISVTPTACAPPTLQVQPQSSSIQSGQSVTLSVNHVGSSPFFYQWYIGQSGNTANPVNGETNRTFTTPALTQTTSYWVRVGNSCGTVDSATAVITVIGGTCTKPVFLSQPSNITIPSGSRTYLAASAQDATSYQWFKGAAGDTSSPVTGELSSNARYVEQLYVDLLGRPADSAAVAAYAGALEGGAMTRTQVATAILNSNEYHTLLINNLYSSLLHRSATPADVSYWLPAFISGLSSTQVEAQILGSTEYFTLAGGTNSAWLARVYSDVLGRTLDSASEALWTPVLATTGRATVAQQILNSAEGRNRRVQNFYHAYLHRAPNASELAAFSGLLVSGVDPNVQAAIVASQEYTAASSIYFTDPISSTTTFWVRAINACGNTDSTPATVTIATCAAPTIGLQPKNGTVNIGERPSLTVGVSSGELVTYQWYEGNSGDTSKPVAGATTAVFNGPVQFTAGTVSYWVRITDRCGSVNSSAAVITVVCGPGNKLKLTAPPTSPAQLGYRISWDGDSRLFSKYELQESATSDFASPTTFTITDGTSRLIPAHAEVSTDKRFYYRVRGFAACSGQAAVYSDVASTLVVAPPPPTLPNYSFAAPPCANPPCALTQQLLIGTFPKTGKGPFASDAGDTFVITSDKPYVTITPSTGVVGSEGTSVTMSVDLTKIPIGSSEATITITTTSPAGKGALASRSTSLPVSISLVTPVTPQPKDNNPPPNTLVIPAVAHADGIGKFVSDVRISNTSSQPIDYQLAYTPTAIDGTTSGKTSTITIEAGETKALNDIVAGWYGAGAAGEGGLGVLEIRPQNFSGKGSSAIHATASSTSPQLATIAASRTYNVAANGTFGQFIPAIPLASFLGKSEAGKISLQQVAQSTSFRTNFGFVEGSGQPVDMLLTLKNASGAVVASRPYSLKAFEHQQMNMSALFPGTSLTDGRLEVAVTSDGGRVTAYASVLDNTTQDPLLVFPVDPSRITAQRYVVPGVAELNNGAANFHTDMRIFNGGTDAQDVTVAYTTSDRTPPAPVQMHLAAGEVKSLDNVLQSVWNISGTGGAVVVTTPADSSLVVTARTYSRRDDGGTLGQFIPGVTSAEAVGLGDRALQVIELEQSPSFRSNLGLVEVTGNPVTIEILGYIPESKVAARTTRDLAPGQFLQLGSVFSQMGFGNVYNGRVSVNVIGGGGRIAAYGSVIDNRTQDPTYVPAQ